MEVKHLYGLDKKGGFKVWSIWTDEHLLTIEHGKEGGKMQKKVEEIRPKNVGKSNETSSAEQAELEAMSRWRKQIDKGYRETKEELEELPLLPMLAHDYLKQGHRIKYPCFGSPKLDGVRCLAIRHADRVELKSRGGKEYSVKHIQDQLKGMMFVGEVWDGELYIHGMYLEDIVSAVKKPNGNTPNLKFVVFDVVEQGNPFCNRVEGVQALCENYFGCQDAKHIEFLQYIKVEDEDAMKSLHKTYVLDGYEGIMLRNYNGLYESGKRSADLQKYKEFFDEEFQIVAVGEDRNGNAVLRVFDPVAGEGFDVCYGDFEERKRQLLEWQSYIGKALTVKYQTRYKDSRLPQFPTGVRIREGEWVDGIFIPSE